MAKFKIDFTGVEDGFKLPSEGPKVCKVKSISLEEGTKAKYLKWTLMIGAGPDKGSQLFHNTSFAPNALFNLRNTISACGMKVPKSVFTIDTDLYIGKIVGVDVVHSEYEKDGQKKKSAKITEIYQVVKTDQGWVRADQKAKGDMEVESMSQQDDAPFDLDESEEIDI